MKIKAFPFLYWTKMLNGRTVKADLIAGVAGAFLVISQGIAYALSAELAPKFGLYAAIVSPMLASLFGSSLHMVSGPTVVLSIVSAVIRVFATWQYLIKIGELAQTLFTSWHGFLRAMLVVGVYGKK